MVGHRNLLYCCFVFRAPWAEPSIGSQRRMAKRNRSFGCCFPLESEISGRDDSHDNDTVEHWISAVWWAFKLDVRHRTYSRELKELLFLDETEKDDDDDKMMISVGQNAPSSTTTSQEWIVQGIPRRPFYKELAHRLYRWNQCYSVPSSQSDEAAIETTQAVIEFMVPGKTLGFEERSVPVDASPPPGSKREILTWLSSAGDAGILGLLGIRDTIGSVLPSYRRLVIPSPSTLQKAANLPHLKGKSTSTGTTSNPTSSSSFCKDSGNKGNDCAIEHSMRQGQKQRRPKQNNLLTVAARARSKHAHRAVTETSFFGVATGSAPSQNEATNMILQRLLDTCVWINCHNFGGVSSSLDENETKEWVLEIRQEQGYGARWLLQCTENDTDSSGSVLDATNGLSVRFRGFLEPQMEDGHENRWRH